MASIKNGRSCSSCSSLIYLPFFFDFRVAHLYLFGPQVLERELAHFQTMEMEIQGLVPWKCYFSKVYFVKNQEIGRYFLL